MKKKLSILGSTGSIGLNVLKIYNKRKKNFTINILAADKNYNLICKQIKNLKPSFFLINNLSIYNKIKKKFKKNKTQIIKDIVFEKSRLTMSDITVSAIPGIAGLIPTIELIKKSKKLLIANKESVICGWNLIDKTAQKYKTKIIPVDSEHFSLMKLLENCKIDDVKQIFLTASGGPFLNYNLKKFKSIKPYQAIKHPKWKMGKKVSIDSATLMNKILESIEAQKLFSISQKKIKLIIHPESLVHAAIEYKNGLTKFLYHKTNMIIPLANAILEKNFQIDNFVSFNNKKKEDIFLKKLNFFNVDKKRYPIFKLKDRVDEYYSTPIIINAANEILVDQFLKKRIPFNSFYHYILKVLNDRNYKKFAVKKPKSIGEILLIDKWARYTVMDKIK